MTCRSKYADSWDTLKRAGIVKLSITPGLHIKLIPAINRRKKRDRLYQFQCAEEGKKYRLRYSLSENGRIMTIRLVKTSLDCEDI